MSGCADWTELLAAAQRLAGMFQKVETSEEHEEVKDAGAERKGGCFSTSVCRPRAAVNTEDCRQSSHGLQLYLV